MHLTIHTISNNSEQQQRHHRHSSDEDDQNDCFASPPPPPAHYNNPPFAAAITETVERERTRLRHLLGRMGNYLAYLTLIAMLITLPMVLYQALSDRKLDLAAYNSAWIMVCGTIIMSVRLVYLHLTHWYMPAVQKIRGTHPLDGPLVCTAILFEFALSLGLYL